MLFANIDDVVLHHRLAGASEGRPLVLVNSLGTDARIWDGVIRLLEPSYRILSYDKRGHGLSDIPEGGIPHWARGLEPQNSAICLR